MTRSGILDLSRAHIWKEYFDSLPEALRDVYLMPEYYEVQEKLGKGAAHCFFTENDNGFVLYPFLLNSIEISGLKLLGGFYDIEGAYGYNGAVSNAADADLIRAFHERFCEYAFEKGIVAEFTRFNPVLRNHTISTYMNVVHANQNIALNLRNDNFWLEDYEHSTRKNINKATRNGLSVIVMQGHEVTDVWLDRFCRIYTDTMIRNNADQFYFFERSYFEMLIRKIRDNLLLFFTMKEDQPVSTELVLYNKNIAYSYLGGTDSQYYTFRPNDILKHSIILTLKEYGVRYYCLGGGVRPGDSLFKYKRSFAKNGIIDFFIGKKIYREDVYKGLVSEWEKKNPEKREMYAGFLLKYRV